MNHLHIFNAQVNSGVGEIARVFFCSDDLSLISVHIHKLKVNLVYGRIDIFALKKYFASGNSFGVSFGLQEVISKIQNCAVP